jgi:uncharacterized protein (DUF302 family)
MTTAIQPIIQYTIAAPLAEAEPLVREALAGAGFGILTEVDVQATLKAKLGADTRPYKILGACNPALAHASLQARPEVGAFLPCGVALFEQDGVTRIVLQEPLAMAELFADAALAVTAQEAHDRLTAALAPLAS